MKTIRISGILTILAYLPAILHGNMPSMEDLNQEEVKIYKKYRYLETEQSADKVEGVLADFRELYKKVDGVCSTIRQQKGWALKEFRTYDKVYILRGQLRIEIAFLEGLLKFHKGVLSKEDFEDFCYQKGRFGSIVETALQCKLGEPSIPMKSDMSAIPSKEVVEPILKN